MNKKFDQKIMRVSYLNDSYLYDLKEEYNEYETMETLEISASPLDSQWAKGLKPFVKLKDDGDNLSVSLDGKKNIILNFAQAEVLHLALWKYYKSQKLRPKVNIFVEEK